MILGAPFADASACDFGGGCFAKIALIAGVELAAVALVLWLIGRGIRAVLKRCAR